MSTTVTNFSSGSYLNRKTPGVYVTEIAAFGTSIVGVPTAVPVFIGYTEFAGDPNTGAALYNTPVQISSLADYTQYFGGAAPAPYTVEPTPNPTQSGSGSGSGGSGGQAAAIPSSFYAYSIGSDLQIPSTMTGYTLAPASLAAAAAGGESQPNQFNLYWSMLAFFNNGGSNCYVVSVGSYWSQEYPVTPPSDPVPSSWIANTISANDLIAGLNAAGFVIGPTMTVIPEACQLATVTDSAWTDTGGNYAAVVQGMLSQSGQLQDRVAIIDLPGCLGTSTIDALTTSQQYLSIAIAPQVAYVSYGAAYAPALNSTIIGTSDILYTNLQSSDNSVINNILSSQAYMLYQTSAALGSIQAAIAQAYPLSSDVTGNTAQYCNDPSAYDATLNDGTTKGWTGSAQQQANLDNYLLAALPIFAQIQQLIANSMNVLPPSGYLAGIWAKSDTLNGVWNAPANIALAGVTSPLYAMNDSQQASFNMPTNGQSICIIRSQPSRGNVVWGARTLDGNSNDYRYIQVRRTLIYVEQSIKQALQTYVFAANDATTWSAVTASISSFLTGLWQQGGLMGSKSSDAFTVQCGLGSTMTSQNILDGYMIVAVTLQMIHPAEFIELTFTQTMGS